MSTVLVTLDQMRALAARNAPNCLKCDRKLASSRTGDLRARRSAHTAGGPVAGIAVTATMKEWWGGKFAHLEPCLQFLEEVERPHAGDRAVSA
jgi:hypothetical protein